MREGRRYRKQDGVRAVMRVGCFATGYQLPHIHYWSTLYSAVISVGDARFAKSKLSSSDDMHKHGPEAMIAQATL